MNCLQTETGELALPAFFASISSVKTALAPSEYLRVIRASECPSFLISAFDLAGAGGERDELRRSIAEALNANKIVLLDSGNYESYWKQKVNAWAQDGFHDVLRSFPCSCAFSFDVQYLGQSPSSYGDTVARSLALDRDAAGAHEVYPIVHGAAQMLPEICAEVVTRTQTKLISVPERELGSGIVERARNLVRIRDRLDEVSPTCVIHLLGTGNPLSICVYVACGAASFDGLEWCQTAVDAESGFLHHLSQGELFRRGRHESDESALGHLPLTLLANLSFYARWMTTLTTFLNTGDRSQMPERLLSLADYVVKRARSP